MNRLLNRAKKIEQLKREAMEHAIATFQALEQISLIHPLLGESPYTIGLALIHELGLEDEYIGKAEVAQ
ncbi:MAG: hypothetical protein ABI702_19665 [Burkholderiales bacterium]